MKYACVICCVVAVAVSGCGTASQHVAAGNRSPEGLLFTWTVVDLNRRRARPLAIERLSALVFHPPGVSPKAIGGGGGGSDFQGKDWKGPSYGISLAADGQALDVTVDLVRDEKTHGARRRVPLRKGESCVVFIPEEAPEFVFILGIDALPADG